MLTNDDVEKLAKVVTLVNSPCDSDDNDDEDDGTSSPLLNQLLSKNHQSYGKLFGTSIDPASADQFTAEFNMLTRDAKSLQRRLTNVVGLAQKSLSDGANKAHIHRGEGKVVDDSMSSDDALQEAHAVHLEILRKKNAQIELLARREQYMIQKYDKLLGEKDDIIVELTERMRTLETTAVTEAVEEAIKVHAHKNSVLRGPIQSIVKHVDSLKTAVYSLSALVKQQTKVMNVYAYRMKWQVHEAIHQEAPPEDVVQSLEAIKEGESAIPPCMRLTDKGMQLYNQLAELFGGVKLFAHIDSLMERSVEYVIEQRQKAANAAKPTRTSMTKKAPPAVETRTIAIQTDSETPPPLPVPMSKPPSRPPPPPREVHAPPEEKPVTLMNQMEEVTHRLEQPHVTEPQKKQLREVLAEAKAITKESAAVTMRSVVESVRERRQLQTLHEMYAQEVKKPQQQPTESTGVHRPIPRHVFCHQCGKGPFPLQRTWRCTNCYERLHRPPLMTMKRLMESKPVVERRNQTNAVDEKYASLFRRIEEHRARREAKLEETRRRLREDQIRILQKIKLILISCAPLRTPISSVPHFQPQTLSTRGTQQQQSSTTTTTAPLPDCLTFKVSALRGGPSRGNGVPGITPQVSQQHQQRSILGGGMRPPILPHYQPQRLEMPSLIQGQKMTDKKK